MHSDRYVFLVWKRKIKNVSNFKWCVLLLTLIHLHGHVNITLRYVKTNAFSTCQKWKKKLYYVFLLLILWHYVLIWTQPHSEFRQMHDPYTVAKFKTSNFISFLNTSHAYLDTDLSCIQTDSYSNTDLRFVFHTHWQKILNFSNFTNSNFYYFSS